MSTPFQNRKEGGHLLAKLLARQAYRPHPLVLALPRGGVPVGWEIARALQAPLDVLIVRKLGVPGHAELAMGAIASSGVRVLNDDIIARLGLKDEVIAEVAAREQSELERRERAYRGGRPAPEMRGRTVILVDDGIATGATMLAAVRSLRHSQAGRIVVATPVAALSTAREMRAAADEFTAVLTPAKFGGVGQWYHDFRQTSDDEVRALLEQASRFASAHAT